MSTALNRAIKIFNGASGLAKAISERFPRVGVEQRCTQSMVWYWANKAVHGVPPEHCGYIEEVTNGEVTKSELRPDIFGSA